MRGRFYGNKAITIDSGGRVKLPSRFLKIFEKDFYQDEIVVAYRESEGISFLVILPERNWIEIIEKIDRLKDKTPLEREKLRRHLNRNSDFVTMDKMGRVVIPKRFADMAGISPGNEVFLLGNGNFIELWNAEKLNEYEGKLGIDDQTVASIFN